MAQHATDDGLARETPPPPLAERRDQPKVLIVEDDPDIRNILALFLGEKGFQVKVAESGDRALAMLHEEPMDLILSDVRMPGMSGLEVAARLREAGSTAAVVFCTVHEDEEFLAATRAAGGLGYVVKPRLTSDLLRAVREANARRPFVSDMPGTSSAP